MDIHIWIHCILYNMKRGIKYLLGMKSYINKILIFIIYCIVHICIKNMIICIENIGGGLPPP